MFLEISQISHKVAGLPFLYHRKTSENLAVYRVCQESKLSQNSKENTCVRVSFLIKLHVSEFQRSTRLLTFFNDLKNVTSESLSAVVQVYIALGQFYVILEHNKCPNKKFYSRIFQSIDRVRIFSQNTSLFSPLKKKYRLELHHRNLKTPQSKTLLF